MRKVRDHFFKRAKREGFLARSVYKLEEADRRYRLLRPGYVVVDLGAAPGSWTQYAAKRVGPDGLVVAVDLHTVKAAEGRVVPLKADVFDVEPKAIMDLIKENGHSGVDVVLSDMAPKTSGNKMVDHVRSVGLAERALWMAQRLLGRRGVFFCKVFQGGEFQTFVNECRGCFDEVKIFKPKSSRKESVETFVFGRGPKKREDD